ncbi:hypothetical protein CRG98_044539 [Punica granatum]|uniref:Uncharacterized protein n=1 Tax=Punica granatum TaxID=22663 RepID=A0A2I0HUA2_PUNGR|nr:hypothetical protein CRG98_044539 [Punica granatum]
MPGLLTRASSPSCTASSPNHLVRAPCNLAGSANTCEFTFLHRKFIEPPRSCPLQPCRFAEPPRSCLLQPCPVSYPVRDYFPAPQVCRATSLVPLATLLGLLTHASLISCTASSPSNLARASCNLTGSTNPCEFTFLHRKFAEPPRSCLLQPCRPPQVRLPTSFVPHATLPGLLTRGSLPSCTASSPNHLARAYHNLAGSAYPCEFTFLHRKFAEPPRSCLSQPSRVCLPLRIYFPAPQVRRTTSLVPLATLQTSASSLTHLVRASCNLARSANPGEFTFLHRKFAEPPRSCPLQPCRGLLTRASLLSCTASSPNHLARASCNLVGSANPCEFTFLHRKFIEPPRSCPLQPCRVCKSVRVYFPAPQLRRATSLVPLANLPGQLSCERLLSCTTNSPSHLARASCNLAGSSPSHLASAPCNLAGSVRRATSLVHLTTLPGLLARPSILSCTAIRRATSLVPLATLPGLLTCASLLSFTASSPSDLARASYNLAGSASPSEYTFLHRNSPSHLARASCNLAGSANRSPSHLARASGNLARSANPSEFTLLHRKFAEPPRSCLLQPCQCELTFLHRNSPSHLARASCNHAGYASPSEFTFLHRKFIEPPRSCPFQPCRVCKSVRIDFPAPQVRRATSLLPLSTLPGQLSRERLLTCTTSSPSHLARASGIFAGYTNPCELTFLRRKFAEPPPSCLLQPCRVC